MKKKGKEIRKSKRKTQNSNCGIDTFFYLLLSLPLPLFIALPAFPGGVIHKLWTCLNSDENLPSSEAFSLDKSLTKSRATWAFWVGLLTRPNEKPSKLRIDFSSCVIMVIGLWQSSCCRSLSTVQMWLLKAFESEILWVAWKYLVL